MLKIINGGMLPTKGSKYSACVDLYANVDITIGAGETAVVPLGVCIKWQSIMAIVSHESELAETDVKNYNIFMRSHYLQLEPRSSLRAKGLYAGTGVIDLDFKDEICLILNNPIRVKYSARSGEMEVISSDFKISKGDKIAQIMLCEHKSYLFGIESEEERNGGFGSTGK